MLAALPPIAGSTPITRPMNDDQSSRNGRDRISQITLACDTARLDAALHRLGAAVRAAHRSTSVMICAKANTPISTGRNAMPPSRKGMPSVRRGWPITGSLPRMVTTQPSAPASRPFSSEASTRPADHRQREDEEREVLPRPELERDCGERPGGGDEEHAAEQAAEERRPDAEPQRAPRLALLRHRKAVERGRDRRRLAGDAEQARGDQAAGGAADVDADHRRETLQRIEAEGERQHHDDGHGDGDARQRAADHADQRAEDERHQVLHLQHVRRCPVPSSSNMARSPSSGRAAAAP